jgi:hypothetical protein
MKWTKYILSQVLRWQSWKIWIHIFNIQILTVRLIPGKSSLITVAWTVQVQYVTLSCSLPGVKELKIIHSFNDSVWL